MRRVAVTWSQALAWRLERQLLAEMAGGSVADVVRRLAAVQTQVASSAELAIRLRRERSQPGDVGRALASGAILKTWAVRGALHLLTPDDGAALLSLMASGKSWERPSWVKYFGLTPPVLERMREVVREALDGKTLTREELIQAIAARRSLRHLADELRSGWGTLLKPLAWQGELCFGPSQGTRVTFQRPDQASRRWAGLPDPEEAAPIAISAYLRAYGPSTFERFGQWLASGYFGRRQLRMWFEAFGDRMAQVEVDGESAVVLTEDVDELVAARPSKAVRLLPGFDQWVLGAGTDDLHVVPLARRRAVSRQSGWIAPTVVLGAVVAGTWKLEGDRLAVEWFAEGGRIPRGRLGDEVARLGSLLGRDIRLEATAG
jgi:hypothetical protein